MRRRARRRCFGHAGKSRCAGRALVFDFADDPAGFPRRRARKPQDRAIERLGPRQQFVEQHAERIDVCARIDIRRPVGLLGAHCLIRPDRLAAVGIERPVGQLVSGERLCDAEIDHFDAWLAVLRIRQNV